MSPRRPDPRQLNPRRAFLALPQWVRRGAVTLLLVAVSLVDALLNFPAPRD